MSTTSDVILEVLTFDLVRRQRGITDDLIVLTSVDNVIFAGDYISDDVLSRYTVVTNLVDNEETAFSLIDIIEYFNIYEPRIRLLPFDNYVIAGGSVTDSIFRTQPIKDLDFFFYGLNESQIYRKVDEIITRLVKANTSIDVDILKYTRTPHVLTVQYDYRPQPRAIKNYITLQFVLRAYASISEILHSFDITAGAVAFDTRAVYMTTMSYFTFRYNLIIVDTTRRSTTFEYRLNSYFDKGFHLLFPFSPSDLSTELEPRVDDLFSYKLNYYKKIRAKLRRKGEYSSGITAMTTIEIIKGELFYRGLPEDTAQFSITKVFYPKPLRIIVTGRGRSLEFPYYAWKTAEEMISSNIVGNPTLMISKASGLSFLRYISGVGYMYSALKRPPIEELVDPRDPGSLIGYVYPLRVKLINLTKLLSTYFENIEDAIKALLIISNGYDVLQDTFPVGVEGSNIPPRPRLQNYTIKDAPKSQEYLKSIDPLRNNSGLVYTVYPERIRKCLKSDLKTAQFYRVLYHSLIPNSGLEPFNSAVDIVKTYIPNMIQKGGSTWGVITENPGTQITSSYNPIIEHPIQWYSTDNYYPGDDLRIRYEYKPYLRLVLFLSTVETSLKSLVSQTLKGLLRSIPSYEEYPRSRLYKSILEDISLDGRVFNYQRMRYY
jgi:hypothetical protein